MLALGPMPSWVPISSTSKPDCTLHCQCSHTVFFLIGVAETVHEMKIAACVSPAL